MKVDDFFIKLNEQLKTYKHQYDRQDEGRVYIGLPNFDFSNFTKDEKAYFVYYLSFFVAFDLLVYSYDNKNYLKQKEKLKLPKFEYGLTNVFVYPNRLYDNYWQPFRNEIFKDVFQLGLNYLNIEIPEIEPLKIFENTINDKDFSTGMFNNEIINEIKTSTNKQFGKMTGSVVN
jgi:hypothetical protein